MTFYDLLFLIIILSTTAIVVPNIRDLLTEAIKSMLSNIATWIVTSDKVEPLVSICMRLMMLSKSWGKVTDEKGIRWVELSTGSKEFIIPLPINRSRGYVTIKLSSGDVFKYPKCMKFYCTPKQLGCDNVEVEMVDGTTKVFKDDDEVTF